MIDFRPAIYFRTKENIMQVFEKDNYKLSEKVKNTGLKGSLTYWKIKNKDVENCGYLLETNLLRGKTT